MARKVASSAPKDDLHGRLALMLCEALLHVLVERRVLTARSALEAFDTVAELADELAERDKRPGSSRRAKGRGNEAVAIIETMRASFAAKS